MMRAYLSVEAPAFGQVGIDLKVLDGGISRRSGIARDVDNGVCPSEICNRERVTGQVYEAGSSTRETGELLAGSGRTEIKA
jgi:hypothetical protein